MKKICIYLLALSGLWLTSCDRSDVKITGRFVANDNETIYLEEILPGTRQHIVDSVSTDDNGFFKMKVHLPDGQPTIYNVVCKGQRVPLLLAPGEKVKINSIGNIYRNYTVEGSEGSEQMRVLKEIVSEGSARLDSIIRNYSSAGEEVRKGIMTDYTSEYYRIKEKQISFIVSNPGSLVALYALYQRLPNDPYLFNGTSDLMYYRLVADSTSMYYPDSPYVAALKKDVAVAEAELEKANMINERLAGPGDNFPEINLPDMHGKQHSLSALTGKVILLDFWSVNMPDAAIYNAELKEIYNELSQSGFEIYQVSVDTSKPEWITAVQKQRLPWISVSDLKGINGGAPGNYNITKIPSNFIIDREGNIVGKDISGEELRVKIKSLL